MEQENCWSKRGRSMIRGMSLQAPITWCLCFKPKPKTNTTNMLPRLHSRTRSRQGMHSHLSFTLTYPSFPSLHHSFIRRIFFFSLCVPVSYFSFSLTDNLHCLCTSFFPVPYSYSISLSGYITTVTNAMALVFEVYRATSTTTLSHFVFY